MTYVAVLTLLDISAKRYINSYYIPAPLMVIAYRDDLACKEKRIQGIDTVESVRGAGHGYLRTMPRKRRQLSRLPSL